MTARLTQVRNNVYQLWVEERRLRGRLTVLGRADPERSSMDVAECAGMPSVLAYYLSHQACVGLLEPVKRAVTEADGSLAKLRILLRAIPGMAAEELKPTILKEMSVSLLKVRKELHRVLFR